MHVQLLDGCQTLRRLSVQNALQLPIPDSVEHQAMLIAQYLFLLLIAKAALGGCVRVGSGPFPNTPPANKDLCLQQTLALAGFALHMVNRVRMLYVRVEAKNHEIWVRDLRELRGLFASSQKLARFA